MNRKWLREFFIKQMDRIIQLNELTQEKGSYWNLTTRRFNPYNSNTFIIEKLDLEEVWNSIPYSLKLDLELFYNLSLNNIDIDEVYKRCNKEPEEFWICVDYGCYMFYKNYFIKYKFKKKV